ncbi:MAG: ribonuclease P protein component [Ignavibacteriales bacterium]|nr:ribonuclease P protein component [Ignavibacteriales bacterium]
MKKFGLSKKEKIKSKNEFALVYSEGNVIYSKGNVLKANYYKIENPEKLEIKVAFAVHKKSGIAVWRNRIKRLLREAYRLNKEILSSNLNNLFLLIVFSPNALKEKNNKKIKYQDICPEVISILNQIKEKVV